MRVFVSILAILILLSCKKAGLNYVKGTVREDISGALVKGATVYLYEDRNKKDGRYLDSVLTNEKGEYTINFSRNPGKRYYVSCKCDKYFETTLFDNEIGHGRNATNFSLSPYSYVKFRYIKNASNSNTINGGVDNVFSLIHPPRASNIYPDFIYATYDTTDAQPRVISGDRVHTLKWAIYDSFSGGLESDWTLSNYPNTYTFFVKKGDTLNYTFTIN
jgi:hypothetical protein